MTDYKNIDMKKATLVANLNYFYNQTCQTEVSSKYFLMITEH